MRLPIRAIGLDLRPIGRRVGVPKVIWRNIRASIPPPADLVKALVKKGSTIGVVECPRPIAREPDQVIVRVVAAGICRTDLYVARGLIPARDPVILGHECSGVVAEVGSRVRGLSPGDRVAIMPFLPCRACAPCRDGRDESAGPRKNTGKNGVPGGADPERCEAPTMLGIDHDGAFAEFVSVPRSAVFRLPDAVTFLAGAYTEPVAASMAVLRSGIRPHDRGLVFGGNRIAHLTLRILRLHGFERVSLRDPRAHLSGPAASELYDFVVETTATEGAFDEMMRSIRRGGRIVLKSRPHERVAIDLRRVVEKELTLSGVRYAPFEDALLLLSSGRLSLEDVLGPTHPLEDFEVALGSATLEARSKRFFVLDPR